jgi:hypothetical protein
VKIGHTVEMACRMADYSPSALLLAAQAGTVGEEQALRRKPAGHRAAKREW